ncbi:MAG: hypothetical protein ILP18_10720 [Treponema sp.]|nr:hypothetical protein [Treponema sp.]
MRDKLSRLAVPAFRLFAAVVFFMSFHLPLAAQEQVVTSTAVSFLGDFVSRSWSASDGLPGNNITDILQARSGYMYFGTYTGLVRFDGIDFLTINRSLDSKYDFVSSRKVFEDSTGNHWVGSNDEGAFRLGTDGSVFRLDMSTGLPNNSIRAFTEDQSGNVWIGTASGVVYCTPEGELKVPEGLDRYGEQNILVQSLYCDTAGRIWLSSLTPGSTYVYSTGSFSRFKGFQSLPADSAVSCIMQEQSGAFWYGIAPHYAIRSDGKGGEQFYDLSFGEMESTIVGDIFQDSTGNIWFSMDRGLAIMHHGQLLLYNTQQGLVDNNVNCVFEDKEGNIWICTDRGGLEKLTLSKFRTVATESTVNAIVEDVQRKLAWLGTDTGLLCYSYADNSFHENGLTEACRNCRIRHVAFDREGRLLVSTYGQQGQFRLTVTGGRNADGLECSVERWGREEGIGHYKTRVAMQTSGGDLYIGTTSGLSIIDHETDEIQTLHLSDGLPNEFIMALYEDDDGSIWGGTDGGGVFQLKDRKVVRTYSTETGLAGNVIFKINRLDDGALWICTGTGLSRLTEEGIFNYDTTNGLGDDGVFQIMTDYTDTAWFTSNLGVFSAKFSQMKEMAAGTADHLDCRLYGRSDGLRSGGVTSTSLSMKDSEGRMWFTMIDGFAVYDPVKVINKAQPLIQIQSVSIDNEAQDETAERIVIPPEGKRLRIKFTGLSFVSPEQMQFSYRLEGFENEYSPWSSIREVSFTNLKPGKYLFYVMAKNSEEEPSAIEKPLILIKRPYIWQLWWFWFQIALFIILAVALIIWNRYRKMKRYQQKLENEVAKQTKELRKQAEELELSNKELAVAKDKAEELLLNILPQPIAQELTEHPGSLIAKQYPNACVLFADLVGFTKMSDSMAAGDIVDILNSLFTRFDLRAKDCGVEKIKTIGDCYMAATGLSESSDNGGVTQMLKMAQGMMQDVVEFNASKGLHLRIRVGVNCGNLVAGVIGKTKFIYDIWGDTVNVASRMESTGTPGCIHVTEAVWEQSHGEFSYGKPFEIEVKGKGLMKTYLLGEPAEEPVPPKSGPVDTSGAADISDLAALGADNADRVAGADNADMGDRTVADTVAPEATAPAATASGTSPVAAVSTVEAAPAASAELLSSAEAEASADEPPDGYTPISLDEIFAAREKEKDAARTAGAEAQTPAATQMPAADPVPVDVAASTVFGPTSGFQAQPRAEQEQEPNQPQPQAEQELEPNQPQPRAEQEIRPVHRTGKGLLATCMQRNEEDGKEGAGVHGSDETGGIDSKNGGQ